jgi:hypothetical protein
MILIQSKQLYVYALLFPFYFRNSWFPSGVIDWLKILFFKFLIIVAILRSSLNVFFNLIKKQKG